MVEEVGQNLQELPFPARKISGENVMKISGKVRSAEKIGYRVTLLLLISVASLSSAVKDLNRMQEVAGGAVHLVSGWLDAGVVTANAKSVSSGENSCSERLDAVNSTEEFRWKGRLAPGKAIEIKGLNGDIDAEPAAGDEIEVLANKKARRSDPNAVSIQVVEHAGGVTICAIYPTDDPNQHTDCVPGSRPRSSDAHRNQSTIHNTQDNDVRVDFTIRVPAGVDFMGRTVNGEITAKSLLGNVKSHTVNGSISISTTGYAEAKTVNGAISATVGNVNWAGPLEFKTLNGEISVNLPASVNTEIEADTFNGDISSDFPLASAQTVSRKHVRGTIGSGGRELILKTFNGSINLRRVS